MYTSSLGFQQIDIEVKAIIIMGPRVISKAGLWQYGEDLGLEEP